VRVIACQFSNSRQPTVSIQELSGPRNRGPSHLLVMSSGVAAPCRLALLTRAPIPQELPRINPQLVPIVEMKLDGVFAHAVGRCRFDRRLEHGQRPRRGFRGLSRLLMGLRPLLVAERARTGIAQEGKRIVRLMSILPLDIETGAGAQVHFYRLGVCHCRHKSSIAYPIALGPRRRRQSSQGIRSPHKPVVAMV